MTQTFGYGDWVEGYGQITGMYHTETHTTYICYDIFNGGYKYYKRSL